MLPNEIFDPNKSKTRDPKRKFAAKEYFMEISRDTRVTDLRTEEVMDLKKAVGKFGIIDIQLVDFAGSLFLENKDWTIKPGFNRLFTTNEINNKSILLEHKLKLVRFMRNFQNQEAMVELNQILKFGEIVDDKYTEFRYICLKGRILLRMRKLEEAKNEFEKAFELLETRFSDKEKNILTIERINRIKPVFVEPNWDNDIIDYDEILLTSFYSYTLTGIGSADVTTHLIDALSIIIRKAERYQSAFDLINLHERLFQIHNQLGDLEKAKFHIHNSFKISDKREIWDYDKFLVGSILQSLIETLVKLNEYDSAEEIISQRKTKLIGQKSPIHRYFHLKLLLTIDMGKNDTENAFLRGKELINLYYKDMIEFKNTSKLFLVREIFHFIMQGIELGNFKSSQDTIKYNDILTNIEENKVVTQYYLDLIKISFRIIDIPNKKFDATEISETKEFLRNLLEETTNDKLAYCETVIVYFRFLFQQIANNKEVLDEILNLSNMVFDNVYSSNFTMIILKNEVIRLLVLGKIEPLKSKLFEIQDKYKGNEVSNLIYLISQFESGYLNLESVLNKIIANEILFSSFDNQIIKPLNSIILQNKA